MNYPHGRLSDEYSPDDMDGEEWANELGVSRTREEDSYNHYQKNWNAISWELREEMNWCCEECGINLKANKHLLHVHHHDRNKTNNERSNLAVVCALCHSKFPNHEHIINAMKQSEREMFDAYSRKSGI